ncbi:glutaredoxin 3 [Ghiorsea bivora]|uniref:glutaredoxin 3 n=1 Tax=Ghiorsea bivora TaxID=1485545 RepID=UPI00056E11A3|nr:glutaredoxin 3 [Ghiorsea bivora]
MSSNAKIEIYSGDYCPYCVRAKSLLEQRGLDFIEYNVQQEPEKRVEMMKRSHGGRSIPQIFINDQHVGGCDELYALDKKGQLDAWLV